MLISADRKQARSVFRYIKGLIESAPMLAAMVVKETTESIELTNRAVIEITTASVRKTRGYTCSCVILDEIAFFNTDTEAAHPDKEIINALRPSLASLGGKLVALSSPYSRKGALFEAYRLYFGKDDATRVLVAQAPTALMNPLLDPEVIAQAYKEDPASAPAEYGAQFRTDVESYISREAVEASVIPDRFELPPTRGIFYFAFTDPSGGSGKDAFTLAICHKDKKTDHIIVDAIRAQKPPFSPSETIASFCDVLDAYKIKSVTGDRFGGEFPRELFRNRGISYNTSDKTKSDLYAEMLPLINSGRVELLDDRKLFNELVNLERRTSRNGKDSIDHAPNQHDDIINAVAGAIVNAASRNANPVNIRISRFGFSE